MINGESLIEEPSGVVHNHLNPQPPKGDPQKMKEKPFFLLFVFCSPVSGSGRQEDESQIDWLGAKEKRKEDKKFLHR